MDKYWVVVEGVSGRVVTSRIAMVSHSVGQLIKKHLRQSPQVKAVYLQPVSEDELLTHVLGN